MFNLEPGAIHLFNLEPGVTRCDPLVQPGTWCDQRHFVVVIVFYIVTADKQAEQQKNAFNAYLLQLLFIKTCFVVVKGIDSLCCFVLSRTRVSSIMLFVCVNN